MAIKGTSPYSVTIAPSKIDYNLNPDQQMAQFKKEEKEAQAPNSLPYELQKLPDYFADMVSSGFQAGKTLETVLNTPNMENKEELFKLKKNLDKIVVYLMTNVDNILEKSTIGYDLGERD